MDKNQLQKAIISILIGAAVLFVNQVLLGLLDLIKNHLPQIVPAAISAIHFGYTGNNVKV